MRVCPKCGHSDPPYWRPAKMHNPSGDLDIARIDDLMLFESQIGVLLTEHRAVIVVDLPFAYLLGKRAVWVKRINYDIFRDCGMGAFKPAFETSKHNALANRVSGRTRTTFNKKKLLEITK